METMLSSHPNRARLKRIASYGEWICVAAMLLLGGYCLFLALQPEEALAVLQRGVPGILTRPADHVIIAAELVALLPVLMFLYALWQTRNLFHVIGEGQFLSNAAQELMVKLGKLALSLSIIGILCHTVVAMVMTSANPPGQQLLLIEISSDQIASVLIAVLLFTFATLMKEFAAIHEDNQSII
jgi:hypothetical protein